VENKQETRIRSDLGENLPVAHVLSKYLAVVQVLHVHLHSLSLTTTISHLQVPPGARRQVEFVSST
jgi:hypothetical protein